MKTQPAKNFPSSRQHKSQSKQQAKNAGHTNARYIYTEEDLGEGILHVGLDLALTGGKKQFNPLNN